jgi:hypothetical protein
MLDAVAAIERITSGPYPLSGTQLGRLAVLRHQAGAQKISQPSGSQPPSPAGDLFAGVPGVPEISGAELTGAHVICGLRYHGALVVRGLVAPADVERLRGLIDGKDWTLFQHPGDANGEPLKDSAPMKCSAASLQGLVEAYQHAGMGAVMREYLGEPPVLLSERLQLDRQTMGTGLPWHQDGAFFGGHVGGLNSFLALDHCGVDATGLSVVAHRFDEVVGVEPGQRANLDYGVSLKDEDILAMAGPDSIVTPVLGPGDAIFFDEMTMHRTARPPKGKPRPRCWAVSWFFAPSRFPELRHPLWFG